MRNQQSVLYRFHLNAGITLNSTSQHISTWWSGRRLKCGNNCRAGSSGYRAESSILSVVRILSSREWISRSNTQLKRVDFLSDLHSLLFNSRNLLIQKGRKEFFFLPIQTLRLGRHRIEWPLSRRLTFFKLVKHDNRNLSVKGKSVRCTTTTCWNTVYMPSVRIGSSQ